MWVSMLSTAQKRPVNPPMVNRKMKESPYSIAVLREIAPLYIVAIQLNTLMAEGIPTEKVIPLKMMFMVVDCPLMNIWCPQTRNEKIAIATEEKAM